MTPAWLTRSGRNWRGPPKTPPPRACLAHCVGIRRRPLGMAVTPPPTPPNNSTNTTTLSKLMSWPPPLPLGVGDPPPHPRHEQQHQHDQLLEADVVAAGAAQGEHRPLDLAALEEQRRGRRRDAGDDAGHNDQADAVADAVLVDLLPQ